MAADCFLHRTMKRFAVGTLARENKPDNHGQVTPTVYPLSLSPDGTLLASASPDKTVHFWGYNPWSSRQTAPAT